MHTEGEPAVARVAERVGVPYALSTMGTTSVEALAGAAPGARRWFQLYLWRDREASAALVERARAAGYEALVLTVDTPVAGPRLRDVRNGFTIPPALIAADHGQRRRAPALVGRPAHHRRRWSSPRCAPGAARSPSWWTASSSRPPTLADVRTLRATWPGALVVKGVLDADDARAVVDAGADAVVVSNHGGRQLDRAPTPLEQLPGDRARRSATGPRCTWTAGSSTAPTSSRRSPSAPAPAWSAGPTSTG